MDGAATTDAQAPFFVEHDRNGVELLVCFATEGEGSMLTPQLRCKTSIVALRTGVGMVNAAHAVSCFIARRHVGLIVVCGVGGAYPGSGLSVGQVVCASLECYADLGAMTPNGFVGMQALGLPIVETAQPLYNTLPISVFPVERRVPFATVACLTGTDEAARSLALRTGCAVENMEGAAIAHVAHLHAIPVGELRAISNPVGDRKPDDWRLQDATLLAQEALLSWIESR